MTALDDAVATMHARLDAWAAAVEAVGLAAEPDLDDPRLEAAEDPEAARAAFMTEYEDTFATPYLAAERGYVDAVIEPSQTRLQISQALRLLRTKRATLPPKKHGNIPL